MIKAQNQKPISPVLNVERRGHHACLESLPGSFSVFQISRILVRVLVPVLPFEASSLSSLLIIITSDFSTPCTIDVTYSHLTLLPLCEPRLPPDYCLSLCRSRR